MKQSLSVRLKNAWNTFTGNSNSETTSNVNQFPARSYLSNSNGHRYRTLGDRSIMSSVLNRIAMDVSAIDIRHCRVDSNNRFETIIDSKLNRCLSIEANIDQTSKMFIQDLVMTMFDRRSCSYSSNRYYSRY